MLLLVLLRCSTSTITITPCPDWLPVFLYKAISLHHSASSNAIAPDSDVREPKNSKLRRLWAINSVSSLAVQSAVLNTTAGGDASQKEEKWSVSKEALLLVVICYHESSQSKRYPHEPALSLLEACPLNTRTARLPQKKHPLRHEDTWALPPKPPVQG